MVVTALGRYRLGLWAAILAISALAWLELWRMRQTMNAGPMAAMAMPSATPGGAGDYAATALMWMVMMVAMMLPSAAPMLMIFSGLQVRRAEQGRPVVATAVFAAGYLGLWAGFSLVAAAAQLWLQSRLFLSPALSASSPTIGAAFLLIAGLYQLSALKLSCLIHCQSPVGFVARYWQEGVSGALVMGLRHGLFCLGCCWAMMGLLFVGGVMNLVWVAGLAAVILLEKALPWGRWIARGTGVGLTGWAVVAFLSPRS